MINEYLNKRLEKRNQRYISERIIVKGTLVLDTPTCLASGEVDGDVDLIILRDSIEEKALLMGSSIAGALRNYLRDYQSGYSAIESSLLFGGQRSEEEGEQSPLIVNDALSCEKIRVELRDGVKINSITKTAEEGAKYDLELLEAGTKFDIYCELLIENNKEQLIRELVIVLQGLEKGEISIGMKKRRGFGHCHVEKWQAWQFDLRENEQRIKWLNFPHWTSGLLTEYSTYDSITDALSISVDGEDKYDTFVGSDCRDRITIQAKFTFASPLLIRSGQASTDKAPDVVHLKSRRNGELKSILSGTSLAGVLRHRAERIVNTLKKDTNIINKMFGFTDKNTKEAKASRLIVDEVEINDTTDLVQNRIAIDRFTGGALHGALFNEQPIFGNDKTNLEITLQLRQPEKYEIGLLLLLLKDLWTGDLTVGGTSSIGRGKLQGKEAIIKHGEKTWIISQNSNAKSLIIDNPEDLQNFVTALALHQEVKN